MKIETPFIIFEGINRVGKTTYTKAMSEELKIPVLRIPRPTCKVEAMRDPYTLYHVWLSLGKPKLMLDRFYPSQFVYHDHAFSDFNDIENLYRSVATIVYMETSHSVVKERWAAGDIDFDYKELIARFEYFLKRTQLPVIRLCSEDGINYEKITL